MEPTPKVVGDESSPPSASKDEFSETNGYHDPVTRRDNEHAEGPTTKTHPANQGQDASGSPDPFDRVATVARTSLAGSLKLISTAVRGVGDAVFQAGTVVEELTGGTGQVAGEFCLCDFLAPDSIRTHTRRRVSRPLCLNGTMVEVKESNSYVKYL